MTQAHYTGGCACRSVRYEASAEPVRMFNCHCRDCQRASGSGYSPIVVFRGEAVKLTGEVKYRSWTSERGTALDRGFCPTCGNPISILVKAYPNAFMVYASSLDDPKLYRPTAQIWTKSAQPWGKFDQTVMSFEKGFT